MTRKVRESYLSDCAEEYSGQQAGDPCSFVERRQWPMTVPVFLRVQWELSTRVTSKKTVRRRKLVDSGRWRFAGMREGGQVLRLQFCMILSAPDKEVSRCPLTASKLMFVWNCCARSGPPHVRLRVQSIQHALETTNPPRFAQWCYLGFA